MDINKIRNMKRGDNINSVSECVSKLENIFLIVCIWLYFSIAIIDKVKVKNIARIMNRPFSAPNLIIRGIWILLNNKAIHIYIHKVIMVSLVIEVSLINDASTLRASTRAPENKIKIRESKFY